MSKHTSFQVISQDKMLIYAFIQSANHVTTAHCIKSDTRPNVKLKLSSGSPHGLLKNAPYSFSVRF